MLVYNKHLLLNMHGINIKIISVYVSPYYSNWGGEVRKRPWYDLMFYNLPIGTEEKDKITPQNILTGLCHFYLVVSNKKANKSTLTFGLRDMGAACAGLNPNDVFQNKDKIVWCILIKIWDLRKYKFSWIFYLSNFVLITWYILLLISVLALCSAYYIVMFMYFLLCLHIFIVVFMYSYFYVHVFLLLCLYILIVSE